MKEIGDRTDLNEDEKSKLIVAKILETKEKSRLHYRIYGTRLMSGGRKNEIELSNKVSKKSQMA